MEGNGKYKLNLPRSLSQCFAYALGNPRKKKSLLLLFSLLDTSSIGSHFVFPPSSLSFFFQKPPALASSPSFYQFHCLLFNKKRSLSQPPPWQGGHVFATRPMQLWTPMEVVIHSSKWNAQLTLRWLANIPWNAINKSNKKKNKYLLVHKRSLQEYWIKKMGSLSLNIIKNKIEMKRITKWKIGMRQKPLLRPCMV